MDADKLKIQKIESFLKQFQSYIALIIIVVVATLINIKDGENVFLSVPNLMNVLRAVSETGIIAIGMTMILILGDIDLSVGSIVGLVSTGCASLMVRNGLGMFPADCGILGIYDPVEKRKALIHSGWRGALQDIAVRAIDIFRMKGSKLSDLKVILSPMIRELVIGQDTIWEFEEYIEKKGSMYNKFVRKTNDGNYIIDLKGIIIMSLLDRGINAKNILNNKPEDTFSEVDYKGKYVFESYRRDKERSRRNIVMF